MFADHSEDHVYLQALIASGQTWLNLRPSRHLRKPNFYAQISSSLCLPSYDNINMCCKLQHHIPITVFQFLDQLCDASASSTKGCNCKFAAISCYISEMVQWCAKVTLQREYEVCVLLNLNGIIFSD